ncbi:hypothetical protein LNW73_22460 [Streptomyces sp. RKAG337]|nr:hypothetical protein [Streptomyces sp. RKAG337]
MAEAQQILRAKGWGPGGREGGPGPGGERRIAAHVREQVGRDFVFITHYPTSIRPLAHMRPAGRPDVTLKFDLLWKGLEGTTGAQRERRYGVLLELASETTALACVRRWRMPDTRALWVPWNAVGRRWRAHAARVHQ